MKRREIAAWTVGTLIVAFGMALLFAPFVFIELFPVLSRLHLRVMPAAMIRGGTVPGPALGTVVNGYWRVQKIAPGTYAIGEPQNDPDNYEYLLIGNRRALLIDSGATSTHDIHSVLGTLNAIARHRDSHPPAFRPHQRAQIFSFHRHDRPAGNPLTSPQWNVPPLPL